MKIFSKLKLTTHLVRTVSRKTCNSNLLIIVHGEHTHTKTTKHEVQGRKPKKEMFEPNQNEEKKYSDLSQTGWLIMLWKHCSHLKWSVGWSFFFLHFPRHGLNRFTSLVTRSHWRKKLNKLVLFHRIMLGADEMGLHFSRFYSFAQVSICLYCSLSL